MSALSPIELDLARASVHVASMHQSSSTELFKQTESKLEALGRRIAVSNLALLPQFSDIQEQFMRLKESHLKYKADSPGMKPRSFSSQSSRAFGSSQTAPVKYYKGKGKVIPEEARRVLGTINQFDDGDSIEGTFGRFNRVTCPSTSLSFISRFLNHGTAGLDSNKVDQLIRIGQERFLEQIAERRRGLRDVLIPEEVMVDVRGNMMATTDVIQAFGGDIGPRPHSPDSFFLIDHDSRLEEKLTNAMEKSLIANAMKQDGGKLIVSFKMKGISFPVLFEVNGKEIRSSLCTPEGIPLKGTQSYVPNSPWGIRTTSKALITMMTAECRKVQLIKGIIQPLATLAGIDPHKRAASTITINGQTTAIGVDVSGDKVKVTLFDSHGNQGLNGSGKGFVYEVEGIEAAADVLLRILYVEDKDMDVRGPMSKVQREMLQRDLDQLNEVGTLFVLPREELVSFAEAVVPSQSVVEEVVDDGDGLDLEEELEEKASESVGVSSEKVISEEDLVIPVFPPSIKPVLRDLQQSSSKRGAKKEDSSCIIC